ncbi:MAG: hypothetical protein KC423_05445 [Anaerolineales bacterium]|nr:hypothetical protein [Anaerolineales bacterium]
MKQGRGGMARIGAGRTCGLFTAPSRPCVTRLRYKWVGARARRPGDEASGVASVNPGRLAHV